MSGANDLESGRTGDLRRVKRLFSSILLFQLVQTLPLPLISCSQF
ncbi:hypothetical protein PVAP13_8KG073600 [Panicum virgatum]|uniref:Uncharacterized protein n=1 Tax=Panicum virgatum TaxID=38727 RepID=A0A8T0PJ29_PANVG|nr:hypothetical protein PVAP13_8KG073600 [Panicum virgatum]